MITLSDKAFAGERDDLSGPAIEKILKDSEEKDHIRFDIKETILLPDGEEGLKKQLIRLADQRQVDLILTTGGTGFRPKRHDAGGHERCLRPDGKRNCRCNP